MNCLGINERKCHVKNWFVMNERECYVINCFGINEREYHVKKCSGMPCHKLIWYKRNSMPRHKKSKSCELHIYFAACFGCIDAVNNGYWWITMQTDNCVFLCYFEIEYWPVWCACEYCLFVDCLFVVFDIEHIFLSLCTYFWNSTY